MTQYIKFAGDSLKRLEEEEVTINHGQVTEKEPRDGFMINSRGWELMYKWLIIKLQWKTVEA